MPLLGWRSGPRPEADPSARPRRGWQLAAPVKTANSAEGWLRAALAGRIGPGNPGSGNSDLGNRKLESPACGNPACAGARVFFGRTKSGPVCSFEGHPVCSRACLQVLVGAALAREGPGRASETYRHRIPLGLLMLSRGWITRGQLTSALDAQKRARVGKLGEWLIRTQGVDEGLVAQALAAQWGVPLFRLNAGEAEQAARQVSFGNGILPRLVIDAFGVVPVRVAARKILYLAVDERVDRCLNTAVESMTGYRVEPVVLRASALAALRQAVLATAPLSGTLPVRLYSTVSLDGLEGRIAGLIAASGVRWSGLVRLREYIWLRMERGVPPTRGEVSGPAGREQGLGAGSEGGTGAGVEDAIFVLEDGDRKDAGRQDMDRQDMDRDNGNAARTHVRTAARTHARTNARTGPGIGKASPAGPSPMS